MDIYAILKDAGVEIPEDKKTEFDKSFRENWKSKKELEAKDTKITNLEADVKAKDELIKTANTEIESYKSLDVETIKKNADEYKTKYEEADKTYKLDLAKRDKRDAIKDKLMDAGIEFTSDYAKNGVVEELMNNDALTLKDGKLVGYDDLFKSIQEAQPKAFVVKEGAGKKTETPPPMYAGAGKTPITPTEADALKQSFTKAKESKNTTEMARLIRVGQEKGVKLD